MPRGAASEPVEHGGRHFGIAKLARQAPTARSVAELPNESVVLASRSAASRLSLWACRRSNRLD